jgi:hypothetical protein
MEEVNPSKKAKLATVEERGRAVGSSDGGAKGEGATGKKEEIQAFTSAPLPLTANSKVGIWWSICDESETQVGIIIMNNF